MQDGIQRLLGQVQPLPGAANCRQHCAELRDHREREAAHLRRERGSIVWELKSVPVCSRMHACKHATLHPMLAGPQVTPGGVVEVAAFDTVDGLYDCAWSEENENILLAASGDGSVKVYDLGLPPQANPLRQFHEHKHEVGA